MSFMSVFFRPPKYGKLVISCCMSLSGNECVIFLTIKYSTLKCQKTFFIVAAASQKGEKSQTSANLSDPPIPLAAFFFLPPPPLLLLFPIRTHGYTTPVGDRQAEERNLCGPRGNNQPPRCGCYCWPRRCCCCWPCRRRRRRRRRPLPSAGWRPAGDDD